jgi:hypothetical protein
MSLDQIPKSPWTNALTSDAPAVFATPVPVASERISRTNKSRSDIHRTTIRDGLFTVMQVEIAFTAKDFPKWEHREVELGDVVNVISVKHEPEWRVHGEQVMGSSQERWLDQESVKQWVKAANYLMSENGHVMEDRIVAEILSEVQG